MYILQYKAMNQVYARRI